jgi:hypothetical protein
MVGANKILTVSYGTFSCTLEGFDEPFSTMRAIAEYFRDLAADDRYFGAEPPTPDAEMLHRIAEREIHRRVEARIEPNGVTLRPRTQAAPVELPAAPVPEPQPQAIAAETPPVAASVPAAASAPEPAPELSDQPQDSVAAKLARIRAAVASARAEAAQAAYSEDQYADTGTAAPLADDFGFDLDFGGSLADVAGELPAGPVPDDEAISPPAGDLALAPEPAPAAAEETFEAETLTTAEEPEVADEPEAAQEPEVEQAPAAAEEPVAAEPPPLAAGPAPEEPERDAQDVMRSVLAGINAETDSVAAEPQPEPAAVDGAATLSRHAARRVARTTAAIAALTSGQRTIPEPEPQAEPVAQAETQVQAETVAEVAPEAEEPPVTPAEPEIMPEPEVVPQAPRPRARVIKVRRPEPEVLDAVDAQMIEAVTMQDIDTPERVEMPEPAEVAEAIVVLSPEAEDDLARELAALEAELEPHAPEQQAGKAAANLRVAPDTAAAPRTTREAAPQPADSDLTRLLSETNTQLEGPENRRRFSAIAHLKAAVAATVADRKLRAGDERSAASIEEERDMELYRSDLTRAVRPRRPAPAGDTPTLRPNVPEQRPAPLVLVSEQRIDRPKNPVANDTPVIRPRRITVGRGAAAAVLEEEEIDETPLSADEAKNFAEFAERLGAVELSELLEAAAAYTASVEGQPYFSRPQIIKKVAALTEDSGYDREAGLRSFGMLLRQGKIAKVKRGQFAITESSRFFGSAGNSR